MPCGKITFDDHLKVLAIVGSWGTQVELQTVSDCFNIAVYVCSANPSGIVRWERKAVPKNHGTISMPPMSLPPSLPFTSSHNELSYSRSHYKSIVPAEKGTQLLPPFIIPWHSDHVLIFE